MKAWSATQLAFAAVGVTALVLIAVGGGGSPTPRVIPPAEVGAVEADGVKLTSVDVVLPAEAEALPPGPNHDLVEANCTACHSAGMITAQPALKPEQWAATVKKMREVYKAPVADGDVAAVLAYLNGLSERQRGPSPAAAATPAPAAP